MGPLGPVALICATPANGQTNRQTEGWTEGRWMLGYVMNFAD